MRALSELEAANWCKQRGFQVSERRFLSFRGAPTLCLVIEAAGAPHQVVHLAESVLSAAGPVFPGGLLWVRERGIWSEVAERVGEHIVSSCRAVQGEARSLDDAPGQLFDPKDRLAAQVCVTQPILVGWDAFFVPEASAYFAFVSHDGPLCLIPKNTEESDRLTHVFADWHPQIRPTYYFG